MKRTFLLPGIAVVITLAILFTGCPQPSDTMTTINSGSGTPLVKLGDPVVRVTAYEGFNVVSWEPVPDAGGYTVWRTDTESSSQVLVGSSYSATGSLSVVDNAAAATPGEKLANGRAYKYIVVATPNPSRMSTSGVNSAQADIYSGKGEATVTANIPDPVAYKVPQAAGIQYRPDPDGTLYVSWTQPANAKATIGYFPGGYPTDAAYTLDSFTTFTSWGTALFSATDAGYLYPTNAVSATFPVIGGKATIAIQTEYFNGTMYAKDKPATLDITLDQYDLDLQWQSSPSLTVDYVYQNAAAGQVQLSWSRIKGDDDVYGGAPYSSGVTYNVWKRETALNEDNLGKVTGDWIKVEYTIVEPGDGDTSNTIYAKETAAVNSFLGKWEYVVYASAAKGSKTSHSRPLTATLNRTLPAEAAINGSPAVAYGGTADPYTIRISATGLTAGVSYKLYRGELIPLLTKDDGTWNTNPVTAVTDYQFAGYDTAPVHTWTGQAIPGDTTAAIYDTGIAPRKSYLYKLVSSLGDTLLGDGATGYIIPNSTASPASVYSNLELTVNPLSGGRDSDQRGYIGASVSNSGYTKDMDVRLFYRRANATPGTIPPGTTETGWTQLAVFDKTTVGAGLTFNSLTVPVPNPVYGEIYRFMAVAYLDNKPIPNLSQDSYSGAVVDNGEEDSSLLSQTRITGLTSTELGLGSAAGQTITGIDGEFLKGAQINVRIVLSGVSTYEQPAPFNLEVMPSNPLRYQVTLSLTNRPNANGYTSYSVEWKYPWEKWEAITSPRVIQSNIIY